MKRLLILIISAFLLSTTVAAIATERLRPFNPQIYTKENLPSGILYMDSGKINFIHENGIVVGDATYPLDKKVQIFTVDGIKKYRSDLKTGLRVEVYASDADKAVYIVIK